MKSKLGSKLIILFTIFFVSNINSQNYRKYWWYKSRLNNDFVKVGLNQGESMPYNQRGLDANSFNNPYTNKLNIGDGTSTLGNYIALLATEYRLLALNGQNTTKTKHELFCALNAINRLDASAESLSGHHYSALNGFFIRDDIPKNFVADNYEHFNYYNTGGINNNPNNKGFHSNFIGGANLSRSDWERKYDSSSDDGQASDISESQDQAYNLLFGLAFVNKYVGENETDNNTPFLYENIGETRLVAEARNISRRIIDHIRDSKSTIDGSSCATSNFTTGWKIFNPSSCMPVPTGDQAQAFAYPLAEIECLITHGYNSNSGTGFSLGTHPHLCPGNGYHNVWSNTGGYATWQTIATSPLPISNDNRLFVENLSAVCNCVYGSVADKFIDTIVTWLSQSPLTSWLGAIIGWAWHLVSSIVSTFVPGFMTNNTSTSINVNAYSPNAPFDHGPLARKVLHGGFYSQNPAYTIQYLLDVMPCDGIYFFGNGQYSHYQWSSSDRLDHPERRGGDSDWKGEYNAIDFMLYHNLWELYKQQNGSGTANITDLSDIIIDQPTGLTCSNVNAYETITSNNTNIGCSNPTYWRAGKTIYFGAGTSITGNGSSANGPNFHAYIQKYDCATDLGVYRMMQVDSTLTGKDSIRALDNEVTTDSYAAGAQYHKVDYPNEERAQTQAPEVDKHYENLITELPIEPVDALESKMQETYPNFTKEFFVRPTVTETIVKAFFKLQDGEQAYLTVMDMKGNIIYFFNKIQSSEFVATIDLTNHASGTYLLKFTTTNGTSKTEKIIKQ